MDLHFYLLILCYLCSSSQAAGLSLIGKKARQSETWSDRVANLAIDGNMTSFSVAASPTNSSALGWWEVDLEGNYQIGQVILTASFEDYNAKYLQNFSIWLLDENRTQHLCSEYNSTENLAPSETRSFPCQNYQLLTRYIRIARDGGPFRPDAMSLAEVSVVTGLPPSKIETPSDNRTEISLIGKKATQSETWSDRVANLAIDGNVTSFSVAASPTNLSALGWWEVDLEGNYQVGEVILTASFEDYNAKYLQNFSIWLLNENRTQQLCNEYTSSESLAPSETRSFPCQNGLFLTRYVRIARHGGSFRPDGLALAEVKVMSGFPPSNIVAPSNSCDSTSNSLTDGFVYELPLVGKKASQSETWWVMVADLAIDGNFTSFSVAASPLNSSVLGWWEVDLGGNYRVHEVRLTSSYEEYNAHYLQNFTIQLLSETRSSSTCYDYASAESIPPNQTRAFPCLDGTFPARYLRISRLGGPFRQDALSLAEVQVFVYSGQSVPSRIYASNVGGYEVYLNGFKTHQSNTWGDHFSSLAVDNNPSTFTISCVTCNNTLEKGVGWWHIDLGTDRPIVAVALTSSLDQYNSNYLQDIIISLTSWNTTDLSVARICYSFNNNSMVPAGTTLTFKCTIQPTWGRFLMVRRMENASFRPDALAIAEFKVYEQTPTSIPLPVTGDSNTTENGTVPKSSIQAIQSATFNNFSPGLALDKNVTTFASAVASSLVPYWSPVAWWQADLGKFYNVSQVDITSPQDDQYARHLVSFSIDVYPNSVLQDPYLTGSIQCAYYPVGNYIAPGTTEKFVCIAPNYGRYLIVRKVKNLNSIPEYLSFAEITIYYK